MPDRVVFLDETSVKPNLTRIRGRSLRGTRLTASAPFGSWGTQTLIAGLSPSDLVAPWVIKGAMDGPAFVTYIRDVLIPEIEPGTAIRQGKAPLGPFLTFLIPRQPRHPSQ